jgi:hypothetical protein
VTSIVVALVDVVAVGDEFIVADVVVVADEFIVADEMIAADVVVVADEFIVADVPNEVVVYLMSLSNCESINSFKNSQFALCLA